MSGMKGMSKRVREDCGCNSPETGTFLSVAMVQSALVPRASIRPGAGTGSPDHPTPTRGRACWGQDESVLTVRGTSFESRPGERWRNHA